MFLQYEKSHNLNLGFDMNLRIGRLCQIQRYDLTQLVDQWNTTVKLGTVLDLGPFWILLINDKHIMMHVGSINSC